jgi:hypothetical protein
VCGLFGDNGVDCKFVRISSKGDPTDVMIVRADMPAISGMKAGGARDDNEECSKWSYVNMYNVEDGTPIILVELRSDRMYNNENERGYSEVPAPFHRPRTPSARTTCLTAS